jgi:hypothetical protein
MLMPHERPYVDMLSSKGISLQEVRAVEVVVYLWSRPELSDF